MNEVRNIDGAKPTTIGDGTSAKLNETIIAQVEKLYRKNGENPAKLSDIQRYVYALRKEAKMKDEKPNEVLKEYLRRLADRDEVFGNLKDGFFPAFDDATDDGDEDDAD